MKSNCLRIGATIIMAVLLGHCADNSYPSSKSMVKQTDDSTLTPYSHQFKISVPMPQPIEMEKLQNMVATAAASIAKTRGTSLFFDSADKVKPRQIIYLDTPTHQLENLGIQLRYRADLKESGKPKKKYTLSLKKIQPSAEGIDIAMRDSVRAEESLEAKEKLEREISYVMKAGSPVGLASDVISFSSKIETKKPKPYPTSIEQLGAFFPGMLKLDIDAETAIQPVQKEAISAAENKLGVISSISDEVTEVEAAVLKTSAGSTLEIAFAVDNDPVKQAIAQQLFVLLKTALGTK